MTSPSIDSHILCRAFSSEFVPKHKGVVLGAAGGNGQPIAFLMKLNPLISHLSLYDIVAAPDVVANFIHINIISKVKGYAGEENLAEDLEGADVVIIPGDVPRKHASLVIWESSIDVSSKTSNSLDPKTRSTTTRKL